MGGTLGLTGGLIRFRALYEFTAVNGIPGLYIKISPPHGKGLLSASTKGPRLVIW
jgi:hypothetical protein